MLCCRLCTPRGTYVEARDEPNDPLFERRARPSLWELERQFRRGAKDAYNQIIVEAFNDEAELDLKELVDNICELVSIYQVKNYMAVLLTF